MDSILLRALLSLTAATLLAFPARAHGGAYNPVGWGIPIPSAPVGPSTGAPGMPGPMTGGPSGSGPSTGGDPSGGLVSWRDWWHFNQDTFLDLRRSIQIAVVRTASDGASGALRGLLSSRLDADLIRNKLTPALSEILADERSNELTTATLIALGRCGDPLPADPTHSLVPALRARLNDASRKFPSPLRSRSAS